MMMTMLLLVLTKMRAVGYDNGTQKVLICQHLMIKITQRYGTSQSMTKPKYCEESLDDILCTTNVKLRGGVVVKALQTSRSRVRFPIVSLEFFSDIILPVALWGCLSL